MATIVSDCLLLSSGGYIPVGCIRQPVGDCAVTVMARKISQQAVSAREHARSVNGKFGEQARAVASEVSVGDEYTVLPRARQAFDECTDRRRLAMMALSDQPHIQRRLRSELVDIISGGQHSCWPDEIDQFVDDLKQWAQPRTVTIYDVEIGDYGHSDDWRYDNQLRWVPQLRNYKSKTAAEKYAAKYGGRVIQGYDIIDSGDGLYQSTY